MNSKETSLPKLHNMLKTYGQTISKGKSVLMVGSSSNSAVKGKGPNSRFKKKKKTKGGPKSQNLKPKGGVQKQPKVGKDVCLHCKQKGHWKRDCEKAKAEGVVTHGASNSSKGIFVIEINMSESNSLCWVLDTACGSHICNNVQGLSDSRPVRPGEVDLRVGNGARVAAERVGTYRLDLPTGFTLELNNCYFIDRKSVV